MQLEQIENYQFTICFCYQEKVYSMLPIPNSFEELIKKVPEICKEKLPDPYCFQYVNLWNTVTIIDCKDALAWAISCFMVKKRPLKIDIMPEILNKNQNEMKKEYGILLLLNTNK